MASIEEETVSGFQTSIWPVSFSLPDNTVLTHAVLLENESVRYIFHVPPSKDEHLLHADLERSHVVQGWRQTDLKLCPFCIFSQSFDLQPLNWSLSFILVIIATKREQSFFVENAKTRRESCLVQRWQLNPFVLCNGVEFRLICGFMSAYCATCNVDYRSFRVNYTAESSPCLVHGRFDFCLPPFSLRLNQFERVVHNFPGIRSLPSSDKEHSARWCESTFRWVDVGRPVNLLRAKISVLQYCIFLKRVERSW